MITSLNNDARNTAVAHSISEFISLGQQLNLNDQADRFDFIDVIDGQDYVIYDTIDSYINQLKEIAVTVELSDDEKELYKFNPKALSYKIYNNTNYYWLILRLNDMCNMFDFSLESNNLLLLTKEDLFNSLTSINKRENNAIKYYNNTHNNITVQEIVEKYK